MTYITDTQVEQSCDTLRKAINAAENSNHAGEVFVVAAANVTALVDAIGAFFAFYDAADQGNVFAQLRKFGELEANLRTALTLAKGGRA